jgi:signal transduction histidine kinase
LHAWEPTTRLAYFAFVAFAGSALKTYHEATRARIELLERSRQLEREIIHISEREQQRIGRDLHDGICQYFAAVGCATASLKADLANAERYEEAAVAGELTDLVEGGVVQIRDLARGLVPVHMHEAGLVAALEQLASSVSRLQNVGCEFVSDGEVVLKATDAATHLYRIAQEAIHNAIRHGEAKRIKVELSESPGTIRLCIRDDGAGISKRRSSAKGMGLKIMEYRARLLGGELGVAEPDVGGTEISCVIPRPENLS